MKRVAITGATGFLGKYLVQDLVQDENIELFLYSTSLSKLEQTFPALSNIHFIETDYSECSLKDNFLGYHAVIHLAAKRMIPGKNNFHDYSCNVEITENLLQLCDSNKVEVFVFASSVSVYDSTKNTTPFREDETPFPLNAYGISKLACENLSEKYKTKMANFRLAQLIGWGEREEYMFTQSLNKIIRNEPVTLWGEGSGGRDYLYAKDAVKCIKLACEKKLPGTYNIGSGTGKSFKEFIETMIEIFGNSNSKIIFDKTKAENREIREMCIDKVKATYGWMPGYTLRESFADMKRSINSNKNG